jgi:farnesyl-diphosphate farnesyltransferase
MGAGDKTVVEHAVCNGDPSLLLIPKLSRSFALTIPKLPPDLQSTVSVAYLLCRAVDTIEDSRLEHPDQKVSQLENFLAAVDDDNIVQDVSKQLTAELSGQVSREELDLIANLPLLFGALNEFSPRQQVAVRTCFRKMASGMKYYVDRPNGLSDMGDLDRYCYVVAGVVGEMLTELFCDHCSEIDSRKESLEKLAANFGQGLQMTNILKDIWDDKREGRCWLPKNLFGSMNLDLDDFEGATQSPNFRPVMVRLATTALAHLDNAVEYTLLIPRQHTGIRLFCLLAVGMAYATLNRVVQVSQFSSDYRPKISRSTVRGVMLAGPVVCRSNTLTRWTMGSMSRLCYANAVRAS